MKTAESGDRLAAAIRGAIARAAADNRIPPEAAPALDAAVTEAVAREPALRHLANAEPWYRSRVTWGALVAGIAPILGLFVGRELGADEQASLVEIAVAAGTLAGAALALHGRWIARTPIGKP